MRTRVVTVLVFLSALLLLVSLSGAAASAKAPCFLSVEGTRIVDCQSRPILLRGLNYSGYEFDGGYPKLHREDDYKRFARLGFNVVRLPISWAMLEPYPGFFDLTYLTRYVHRDIQWAKKYGVYVVLDMHQWKWSSWFGGSGVPAWAVEKYKPTQAGMIEAISNFWVDTDLQEHLATTWQRLAKFYANEPTIAGYDILNEPFVYTSVIPYLNSSFVKTFYARVIQAIRAVDSNHMIFLEPSNMQPFKVDFKNIVWAPHFYTLSFVSHYSSEDLRVLEADLASKYERYVVGMGAPMWIGEFAAFMKDESSDRWLEDSVRLFSEYELGWAWWTYGSSSRTIPSVLSASLSGSA